MFAVLRFQKLKTQQEISAMYVHWRRDKHTPNADPHRKIEFLLGACTADDVTWKLPAKFRSNAVLAMEGVVSASPSYFRPEDPSKAGSFDPARTAEWVERSLAWLKSEFGDRLVSVVLHLDEATPHLHIAVVPLKDGKLCAREVFNPAELERMQTEYARAVVPLGIQRGRKKSPAKHQEVAQYYGRVREAAEPLAVSVGELAMMQLIGRTPPALAKLQAQAADGQQAREEVVQLRDEAARASRITDEAKQERQALQNRLRAVPLADVLPQLGYRATSKTGADWIGPAGRITTKVGADGRETFRLHDLSTGGRGAIDLVKLAEGLDFAAAVAWLATSQTRDAAIATAAACAEDEARAALDVRTGRTEIVPISRDPADLLAVADRLVFERHLPEALIQPLVDRQLIGAARSGGDAIGTVFPLHAGSKVGLQADHIGVRIEGSRPDEGHWGLRGRRGVWSFAYPGPRPGGREVVVLGQSPTSVLSTCALARERQGLIPALEQDDIGRTVFVAAEGAARDEVRAVLRAAAARGAEVVTAFDPDERGRRLGNLVREEAQATPAARVTGVSGLVSLAGEHLSGFWSLWMMMLAEGAQALRERIEEARAARKRGQGGQSRSVPVKGTSENAM
ncbi:MobV family relaxase [Methylobacterium radiotolerans]|uniref:MobV family relaxase n=1 Tax=Methylobacterium radiotolerans TaxID=31998 RepID=UPI0009754E99|nr:MobV family relaxase [Methylobacterium radiotolerans]